MGAGGSVIGDKWTNERKRDRRPLKDFEVGAFIAEGVSGKVFCGKDLVTKSDVALKFFGYCHEYKARKEDIRSEIDAMMAVRGIDGLVQIQGYFLDTKAGLLPEKLERHPYPVIVMELLEGGPLFGRLNYRDSISEKFISHIFKKMISSLQSLHNKNFIHRDLKMDNVMFLEKSYDSAIKIIDLGNIVALESSGATFTDTRHVGTLGLLAPETISHMKYSKKTDIWQAGCTLYSLLSGLPPFDPNNQTQATDFSFFPMTGPAWDEISSSAKALVTKLLKRNPDHRLSVEDILLDPWLVDEAPNTDFNPDYFTRIKQLALRNKMKTFFLETSLVADHTKRKKSLAEAIPIFRAASSVKLLLECKEDLNTADANIIDDVEEFNSKMKVLKKMVVSSLSVTDTGVRKEIDYTTFIGMLKECHLQELCSLQIFNIFDIGNTGTIDPREFLLTMLAFRPDKHANDLSSSSNEGNSDRVGEEHKSTHNDDEIRLFFNVFDINETGYIDLEELKTAVNFLLYMGSNQPQALPNVHELFTIIDVTQNGQIDFSEFKQFYRHLISSHVSIQCREALPVAV